MKMSTTALLLLALFAGAALAQNIAQANKVIKVVYMCSVLHTQLRSFSEVSPVVRSTCSNYCFD
jgi:hypothetical protein